LRTSADAFTKGRMSGIADSFRDATLLERGAGAAPMVPDDRIIGEP
jgi:hypothetical protein